MFKKSTHVMRNLKYIPPKADRSSENFEFFDFCTFVATMMVHKVHPVLPRSFDAFSKKGYFQNVGRSSLFRTRSQNVRKSVKKQQKPSNTISTS